MKVREHQAFFRKLIQHWGLNIPPKGAISLYPKSSATMIMILDLEVFTSSRCLGLLQEEKIPAITASKKTNCFFMEMILIFANGSKIIQVCFNKLLTFHSLFFYLLMGLSCNKYYCYAK